MTAQEDAVVIEKAIEALGTEKVFELLDGNIGAGNERVANQIIETKKFGKRWSDYRDILMNAVKTSDELAKLDYCDSNYYDEVSRILGLKFVSAKRDNESLYVYATYSLCGTEFTVEWCNIHPSTGDEIDFYLSDENVSSDDVELVGRVEKTIALGETPENDDINLYLFIRDVFDAGDAEELANQFFLVKNVEYNEDLDGFVFDFYELGVVSVQIEKRQVTDCLGEKPRYKVYLYKDGTTLDERYIVDAMAVIESHQKITEALESLNN